MAEHRQGYARKRPWPGEALDPLNYRHRLQTAIEALYGRHEKAFGLWEEEGTKVALCVIIVCQNTVTSKLVDDFVSGFNRKNANVRYATNSCFRCCNFDEPPKSPWRVRNPAYGRYSKWRAPGPGDEVGSYAFDIMLFYARRENRYQNLPTPLTVHCVALCSFRTSR